MAPDDRIAEVIALVKSKRGADGRWPLGVSFSGRMPVDLGEAEERPSRRITLRALRVLKWANR